MVEDSQRPSLRPTQDRTRSTRAADSIDRVEAPPFGVRRILAVVAHDLFGTKDVQDAITASYVWLADQLGHLTLGFVPTLVACAIVDILVEHEVVRLACSAAAAAAIFAVWVVKESIDSADAKARAGGVFVYNSGDIEWNVTTALLYFGIGGALAFLSFVAWWAPLAALALALYPAWAVAFWWLRRKVAFQQAGLPYLYRLTNFTSPLEPRLVELIADFANLRDRKVKFWDVLRGVEAGRRREPKPRHLVIAGTIRAGKTSLCVGVGAEIAFALSRGRYLSAAKLVEQVLDPPPSEGDREYSDGRMLWALKSCDLVIVDDVDIKVRPGERPLVTPDELAGVLTAPDAPAPLDWLGRRRSLWVIGDPKLAPLWRETIAKLIHVDPAEVGVALLPGEGREETQSPQAMGILVQ